MRGSAAFRTGVAPGGALAPGWVKNELWRKARTVPSLDLRFADNKSLVDATTGASLVTFTRASSGTFVGSDGVLRTAVTNEPRFDHNPTTGESLGLLVEESRTNLLLRSEEFDNAVYDKNAVTVSANAIVSPTNNVDADLVIDSSASLEHYFSQSCSTTTNQTYTQVIFAKAGTAPSFRMMVVTIGSSSTTSTITFTQTAGVFVASAIGGLITSATAVAVGNGWYRCAVTYTLNGTVTAHQMRIYPYLSGIYVGTGLGTYFWGAQLEVGAFPTSYIPTTTAAATRSADVASISGSNFSSWYNQTEGTLFCEYNRPSAVTSLRSVVATSDGGFATRATFRTDSSTVLTIFTVDGGVGQATFSLTAVSGANNKGALAYKVNDFNAAANGLIGIGDTSASVGVVNQLSIGSVLGAEPSCSYIRRITFWPVRLPNTTLQSITQ